MVVLNREAAPRREVRLATDRKGVDAVVDSIKGRRKAMIAGDGLEPALLWEKVAGNKVRRSSQGFSGVAENKVRRCWNFALHFIRGGLPTSGR